MSAKTKIVVLRMKNIVYTIIIIALLLFLLIMAWLMFGNKKETTSQSTTYYPGKYSASLQVGDSPIEVIVTVNDKKITGIDFENLSKTIATAYPLMQPALESIANQLLKDCDFSSLTYDDSMKYTQKVLVQTIKRALTKAQNSSGIAT
ncbi:hypothetical protein P261_01917 [Lachnospiraceae bacterium TWA4]|nr:hypothetical protein P261_01917 [Lachnospiraceae bacterium TWA4]